MSVFVGAFNTDHQKGVLHLAPETHALLRRLGPDGHSHRASDHVTFGHYAFHAVPESRLEKQPFKSASGVLIAWDGRLDNRHELQKLLDLDDESRADVHYLCAAYDKWGHEFAQYLRGDYACSLWDGQAQRLLLMRDPFGTRPLYYGSRGEVYYWSSEIAVVVHLIGKASIEIDDAYVAGFLTSTEEWERTPYVGIKSVPPGSVTSISASNVETKTFWRPQSRPLLNYRKDEEYEEHFRSLFRESVRRRLRVDGPVAAELSGGLDSSSVVCVADSVMREGCVPATALVTLSHVYDESTRSDERRFIRIVEDHRGKPGYHIRESDYPLIEPFDPDTPLYLPNPLHCFAGTWRGMQQAMSEMGARVLLSGQGGDHVFQNETTSIPLLAELLIEGRLSLFWQHLQKWTTATRANYVSLLWESVVWPFLPLRIRTRCCPSDLKVPVWFDRSFVKKWGCQERVLARTATPVFSKPTLQRKLSLIYDAISLISPSYYRERFCVDIAYPFLDQDVVEFLLAVPTDQKMRPGESRSLQRRSMRPYLPAEIHSRRGKRGPDEAVYRSMAESQVDLRISEGLVSRAKRLFSAKGILRSSLVRLSWRRCSGTATGTRPSHRDVAAFPSMLVSIVSIECTAGSDISALRGESLIPKKKGGEIVMQYEAPEVAELGNAAELTLGCSCSGCDCAGGKKSSSTDGLEDE